MKHNLYDCNRCKKETGQQYYYPKEGAVCEKCRDIIEKQYVTKSKHE
jgi:recombinational DNA repair protein (RecF pathway)